MPPEHLEQLKVGLEHGRTKFIYHAGQRQTSIRFFFLALAIVSAAFVALLTADDAALSSADARLIGLVLGGSGILISLFFWALDCRNAQLVGCDEALLKKIEGKLANLCRIPAFETIKSSDKSCPHFIRYGVIMPCMFILFILLSTGVVVWSLTRFSAG